MFGSQAYMLSLPMIIDESIRGAAGLPVLQLMPKRLNHITTCLLSVETLGLMNERAHDRLKGEVDETVELHCF